MNPKLTRRPHLTSWTMALVALASGCQLIAGIDKAEYDPDWDSGTDTENTGDGDSGGGKDGSSGDGDATASGDGDATATGDGDATATGDGDGDATASGDGDATASGDGDATASGDGDGDGGPVPGLSNVLFAPGTCSTAISVEQADLESCLFRVSCDPDNPSFSLSACLTFDYLGAYSSEACSAGAQSCEEVYECIGRRPLDDSLRSRCLGTTDSTYVADEYCPGFCSGSCESGYCGNSYYGYNDPNASCDDSCSGHCTGECWTPDLNPRWECDGDWAIDCTQNGSTTYNCNDHGSSCKPATWRDADSAGGCVPDVAAIDCNGTYDSYQCANDTTIYWCDTSGEVWGFDCPGSCVSTSQGAYCALGDEQCPSGASDLNCNGSTLEYCDDDGLFSKHDCGRVGLDCDPSGDCIADGCDSSACEESCEDGNLVHFCVGGSELVLDCQAYGFEGCKEWTSDSETLARCVVDLPPADDSCVYARDDFCDEPWDCAKGTDMTDCRDTCASAHNGVCDVGNGCPDGTDGTDCGDTCTWALDGVCDSRQYCLFGTDTTDCEANSGNNTCYAAYDGFCDEGSGCAYGTDSYDCDY